MLVRHFLHLRDIARLLLGQKDATFFYLFPKTCLIVSKYLTGHPRLEVSLLVVMWRAYTHISRPIAIAADTAICDYFCLCCVPFSSGWSRNNLRLFSKRQSKPRAGI